MLRAVSIAALSVFTPLATAQQKRPLIGQVTGPDGGPVAEAMVTVAWSPAGHPDLGQAEVVQAKASRRGYFTASVPAGKPLCVWAVGPADADGRSLVSETTLCSLGVQRFVLSATTAATQRQVEIKGLEEWQDLAPFTLRLHPCSFVAHSFALPVGESATVEVPPLPTGRVHAVLHCRDGSPLHAWSRLSSSRDQLTLPPRQKVPVLALDPDDEPVPAVEIWHRCGDLKRWDSDGMATGPLVLWRKVGTTGADGRAEVLVPAGQDPITANSLHNFLLRGSKAGSADSHSGRQGHPFVDGLRLDAEAEPPKEIKFVMHPAEPLRGKLVLPPNQRPERIRIAWISKIAYKNGWTHVPRNEVVGVAEDGSFAYEGLPRDAYEIKFQAGHPSGLPTGLLPTQGRPQAGYDPAPGGLQRVDLTAKEADGSPCMGVLAMAAMPVDNHVDFDPPLVTFGLDLGGKGSLMLPVGDWILLVSNERGYGFARAFDDGQPANPELTMTPYAEMHGRVTDEQGQPVSGAVVDVFSTSSSWRGRRTPEDDVLDALAHLAQERYAKARTDAEGKFTLRFLPRANRRMKARATIGDRKSDEFLVEVQEDPIELVVR